ncbi:MAG TPA: hypothetical protein GX527_12140 [Clostridiaceae bacterium]|nr:hypothetical protein [Clostridiaceae bacterium]
MGSRGSDSITTVNAIKPAKCLAIFLVLFILFQIPVLYNNNIKNRRYNIGEPVIVDIDMEQTVLFADSEMWKKNYRLHINRIYLLYYLEFILIFNLNLFLPLRDVIVDIKKTISSFTLVYFSGSKYRSTYTCCYSL